MRPCCSRPCKGLVKTLLKPGEDFVDDLVEDFVERHPVGKKCKWRHLEAKFLNNASGQIGNQ